MYIYIYIHIHKVRLRQAPRQPDLSGYRRGVGAPAGWALQLRPLVLCQFWASWHHRSFATSPSSNQYLVNELLVLALSSPSWLTLGFWWLLFDQPTIWGLQSKFDLFLGVLLPLNPGAGGFLIFGVHPGLCERILMRFFPFVLFVIFFVYYPTIVALSSSWSPCPEQSSPSSSSLPPSSTSLQRRNLSQEDSRRNGSDHAVALQVLCSYGESHCGLLRWMLGSLDIMQHGWKEKKPGRNLRAGAPNPGPSHQEKEVPVPAWEHQLMHGIPTKMQKVGKDKRKENK